MQCAAFYSDQTWMGNCPSCTPEKYNIRYMLHIIIWDVRVEEGFENLGRLEKYDKGSR